MKGGVKIAFGTDAGYGPVLHATNAYELELMVENGMTPMQALMSATKIAAECLRLEDKIGTIEAGRLADVIIVEGDPLEDIKILQDKERISCVMKEGQICVNRMKDQ